jgi:RNA polymerase sigma-70 factor (ECF subfamily)
MPPRDEAPVLLLELARAGDLAALGRLLDLYRNYLKLIARSMIGPVLRARVDDSDLVQEVHLRAHRGFADFLGAGEPELLAWLRAILARTLADQLKHHRAAGRDARRDASLEAELERCGHEAQSALATSVSSPSAQLIRRERAVLLADAVSRLPEDYREVFLARHVEHRSLDDIATAMGRSPEAVRKLWTRALLALRKELEALE